MRVALFHNWSRLGAAVAHALLDEARDEVFLVGSAVKESLLDAELVERAAERGAACALAADVASEQFLDELRGIGPEVVVVATFPTKLPARLLAIPGCGAFNVHASLLPAYRGAYPEFWAIRNGDTQSGVSLHHMTQRFDAGDIVSQRTVDVAPDETLGSLSTRLSNAARRLVLECLARLRRGESMERCAQDERGASRAPAPTAADLTICWADSGISIERLVRACDDEFDPETMFRGERLVVRAARAVADGPSVPVGTLRFDRDADVLWAGTGDMPLALDLLEHSSERMTGAVFAHRHAIESSETLSDHAGPDPRRGR